MAPYLQRQSALQDEFASLQAPTSRCIAAAGPETLPGDNRELVTGPGLLPGAS